jgi:hypothetical protein
MHAVFDLIGFPKRDSASLPTDVDSGTWIFTYRSTASWTDRAFIPNAEALELYAFVSSNRTLLNKADTSSASDGEVVSQPETYRHGCRSPQRTRRPLPQGATAFGMECFR